MVGGIQYDGSAACFVSVFPWFKVQIGTIIEAITYIALL